MFTKTVLVPAKIEPCNLPAFHIQQDCANDITCYILQFVYTVQDEQAVLQALLRCPYVSIGKSQGPRPFIKPMKAP